MDRRGRSLESPFGGRRIRAGLVWAAALSVIPLSFSFGSYLQIQRYDEARGSLQTISDRAAVEGAFVYFTDQNNTELDRKIASEEKIGTILHQWESSQARVRNITWKVNADPVEKRFDLDVMADSATILSALPLIQLVPIKVSTAVDPTRHALEVALIVDSSSSLNDFDQFTAMRRAAKDYVNDLMDVAGSSVKISVIPWAALVNINSEAVEPDDSSAVRDIDYLATGSRRPPPQPLQSRLALLAEPLDPSTRLSSDRLVALSQPTQWRGCVRSSPGEVQIDADNNVVKTIDDQPPPSGVWPLALLGSSIQTPFIGQCLAYQMIDQPLEPDVSDVGRPTQARFWKPGTRRGELFSRVRKAEWVQQCVKWSYSNSIRQCLDQTGPSALTDNQNGTLNAFQPNSQDCSADLTSNRPVKTGVNRACLSDPNEIDYLTAGGVICPWGSNGFGSVERSIWGQAYRPIAGPNLNCPAAILPLSSNRRQILDKLNELYPVPGGSQSDIGLTWALRTLSPSPYWTRFWGLGAQQGAGAFGPSARKIAVLITDGRNDTPIDYEGYYGCTRESRRGSGACWRSGNVANLTVASLNALTLAACQTMRETYGIKVYVILTNGSDPVARNFAAQCTGANNRVLTPNGEDLELLLRSSFSDLLRPSNS